MLVSLTPFLALRQRLVIREVTVIEVTAGLPREHLTVTARNGRIASIAPAHTSPAVSGARVIDGHGRFLVPGFVDAHAHVGNGG